MNDYECPYCGTEHKDIDHEQFGMDEQWERYCESCDKLFMVRGWFTKNYDTWKADCMNGGSHKFEQIIGYPNEWFIGKFRCVDCGKEEHRGGHYWPELSPGIVQKNVTP